MTLCSFLIPKLNDLIQFFHEPIRHVPLGSQALDYFTLIVDKPGVEIPIFDL